MRILLVTHSYPRRHGDVAGAFILRLAKALVAAGHELLVLAPSAPGLEAVAEIDGVTVRRYRYAPSSWETLAYTGTMAEQALGSATGLLALGGMVLGGTLALRRVVASFAPDVIHAHWWFPSGLFTVGSGRRTPVITTLHGSDVRLARASPFPGGKSDQHRYIVLFAFGENGSDILREYPSVDIQG